MQTQRRTVAGIDRITAHRLAVRAHAGQFDGNGRPLLAHVERVALAAEAELAPLGLAELGFVVGMLHDTVEKGGLAWEDLVRAGVSPGALVLVDLLTQRRDEPADAYLRRCASDPLAIAVKRVDLLDKLHEGRLAALPPDVAARARTKARARLDRLEALALTAAR